MEQKILRERIEATQSYRDLLDASERLRGDIVAIIKMEHLGHPNRKPRCVISFTIDDY